MLQPSLGALGAVLVASWLLECVLERHAAMLHRRIWWRGAVLLMQKIQQQCVCFRHFMGSGFSDVASASSHCMPLSILCAHGPLGLLAEHGLGPSTGLELLMKDRGGGHYPDCDAMQARKCLHTNLCRVL
jgi:hypothetical protein